jgi:hypothetical protein
MATLTKDTGTEDTGEAQSAHGVERLLTKVRQRSFPDRSGRSLGLAWAAWRDETGYKVYVLGSGGDLLKRTLLRSRRRRRVQWHRAGSEEGILGVLWKLYWRTYDPERPLEELQSYIRKETNRRCRHEQYQQRHDAWLKRQTVRTERRPGGGTMNWIE